VRKVIAEQVIDIKQKVPEIRYQPIDLIVLFAFSSSLLYYVPARTDRGPAAFCDTG
jgi:hypothetical protein